MGPMAYISSGSRSPSVLCLTCINRGGGEVGSLTQSCGAGVKQLADPYNCASYVRLFALVPFLSERRSRPSVTRRQIWSGST